MQQVVGFEGGLASFARIPPPPTLYCTVTSRIQTDQLTFPLFTSLLQSTAKSGKCEFNRNIKTHEKLRTHVCTQQQRPPHRQWTSCCHLCHHLFWEGLAPLMSALSHICNILYTGRIFWFQILHEKIPKRYPQKSKRMQLFALNLNLFSYTWQDLFTFAPPLVPVTNIRYALSPQPNQCQPSASNRCQPSAPNRNWTSCHHVLLLAPIQHLWYDFFAI